MKVNSKHFAVVSHRLFQRGTNGLLQRCMSEVDVPYTLAVCHDSVCGGHFFGQFIGKKIIIAGYFWPTLFKDAHDYVKRCDVFQRYARNDLRMEMPLHVSLPLIFS